MMNLIFKLNCPTCLINGLNVTLTGVHKGSSSDIYCHALYITGPILFTLALPSMNQEIMN